MLNTKPTYGQNNIDVRISDIAHLYHKSAILPSVPTDIPAGQPGGGKPSDHPIFMSKPKLNRLEAPPKEVIIKKTRRMDDEKKRKLSQWITRESWEMVFDGGSATGKVDKFTKLTLSKLDEICPDKMVKITKLEAKLTSKALQTLSRQRLRELSKNGNCLPEVGFKSSGKSAT